MISWQIAFAHSLHLHLRRQNRFHEFQLLLSEEEFGQAKQQQNCPNFLLHTQGMRIKAAMQKEMLGAFDNIHLDPYLAAFSHWQGGCEQIKDTPLQMNYKYFAKRFLYVYIFAFPVSLVGDFARMDICVGYTGKFYHLF